jgi:hypothetical protein
MGCLIVSRLVVSAAAFCSFPSLGGCIPGERRSLASGQRAGSIVISAGLRAGLVDGRRLSHCSHRNLPDPPRMTLHAWRILIRFADPVPLCPSQRHGLRIHELVRMVFRMLSHSRINRLHVPQRHLHQRRSCSRQFARHLVHGNSRKLRQD